MRALQCARVSAVGPDDKPVKLVRKRLDADGVIAHVEALAANATDVQIRVKGATTAYSESTTDAFATLARRLVAGEVVALQIRFAANGAWWCDTIVAARGGFRLVRMRESA